MDFIQRIVSLSKAVDIVNFDIAEQVLFKIAEYLKLEYELNFCSYLFATQKNFLQSHEGLVYGGEPSNLPLKKTDGTYSGQAGLAFDKKEDLWIVSQDGTALSKSRNYIDLLGHVQTEEIPRYLETALDAQSHTSIIIPVNEKGLGVVDFEFKEVLSVKENQDLYGDLKKLARALARVCDDYREYKQNRQGTSQILRSMSLRSNLSSSTKTSNKPKSKKVFFAYASPERTDKNVLGNIKKILYDYKIKQKIEIFDWSENYAPGLIAEQIRQDITEATYLVAYLSENNYDTRKFAFKDNHNVLIELGMAISVNGFNSVIPIRESNSEPVPFDIMGNRTLYVPRSAASDNKIGEFNEYLFVDKLEKMLSEWCD